MAAYGDYAELNACLFENYATSSNLQDDNMERTAYFLDMLSWADIQHNMMFTKGISELEFQHLPAHMFKYHCADG